MIIPIIQSPTLADFEHKLKLYQSLDLSSKPTHLQIDINDGFFSDNFSVQPADLRHIDWQNLTHEYHLLVDHPDEYLGDISQTGATTVIAQIEHMDHRLDFLQAAKQLGLRVGFGLDFYTPVSELTLNELNSLDVILLMSYKAGWSGPVLNPEVSTKVIELRNRGFSRTVEIDGGVNPQNLSSLIAAGATAFAVNSYIWHDNQISNNIQDLLAAHASNT